MKAVVLFVLALSALSDEQEECKRKCLEQRIRNEHLCEKYTEGEERGHCMRGAQNVYERCVERCTPDASE